MADKEATVVLKMSADLRATIGIAAQTLGVSLTTFIIDAALKRAQQVQHTPPSGAEGTQVSGQFRTLCHQAADGAANGYATPGWYLAALLGGQPAGGLEGDAWSQQVDALKALLANHDDEATWQWFEQHFPAWAALIPSRRREQFVYGVRCAYEEDRINP